MIRSGWRVELILMVMWAAIQFSLWIRLDCSAQQTCPSLPQGLVDFSAGMGDTLSFGITRGIRSVAGISGGVDVCSGWYAGGEAAGIGVSLAFGGAHLGRNAAMQMGRRGGTIARLERGVGRLVNDPRTWDSVRDTWSLAAGGGSRWLQQQGVQLHHWFRAFLERGKQCRI